MHEVAVCLPQALDLVVLIAAVGADSRVICSDLVASWQYWHRNAGPEVAFVQRPSPLAERRHRPRLRGCLDVPVATPESTGLLHRGRRGCGRVRRPLGRFPSGCKQPSTTRIACTPGFAGRISLDCFDHCCRSDRLELTACMGTLVLDCFVGARSHGLDALRCMAFITSRRGSTSVVRMWRVRRWSRLGATPWCSRTSRSRTGTCRPARSPCSYARRARAERPRTRSATRR